MGLWLRKIRTPSSLILTWEAPLGCADRLRWAIGTLKFQGDGQASFRYFDETEFVNFNLERTSSDLAKLGFRGYPAFKLEWGKEFVGKDVLNAFKRRLPSPDRPDFQAFKQLFRIPESVSTSDAGLLSITNARQPGDGFALVDSVIPIGASFDIVLEIVGARHYPASDNPRSLIGRPLALVAEPENPMDPHAVAAFDGNQKVGYVNRLQAKSMAEAVKNFNYKSEVCRINGTADRPRIFCVFQFMEKSRTAA